MHEVKLTKDINILKQIYNNPILYRQICRNPSDDIDIITKEHLIISQNESIMGCFEIREFTKKTIEAHILVLPEYWKLSLEIVKAGEDWAKQHNYLNILTTVPKNCGRMIKFVTRMGFKPNSMISNGIIFKDQLVDLFIFIKEI